MGFSARFIWAFGAIARDFFWKSGTVFIPYTIGVYVLQHVKGVVKMVIFCVNDWSFLPALDTFGKKRRPHRRGLTARSDQSLSPSANCSRSRFVVAKFNFRTINKSLEYPHAAPKRLREQLASVTSESDELRERKLESAWSAFFSSKVRGKRKTSSK